jgi:hypothetical protein
MSAPGKTSMVLTFTLKVFFALRDKLSAAAASAVTAEPWFKDFAEAAVRDRL